MDIDDKEAESDAVKVQARVKLSVMVRLHNETTQRHGAICRQLETKRLALETLQRQLAPPSPPPPPQQQLLPSPPPQQAPSAGPRMLQVVVAGRSDLAPITANHAQFGPSEVSVHDAQCVQALPRVADRPLTNAQDLVGCVAVIDRGVVPVVEKARRAQQAGAIAVFLINTEEKAFAPSGHGADKGKDITIPVVTIPRTAGSQLQALLPQRCSAGFDIAITGQRGGDGDGEQSIAGTERPQRSVASPSKLEEPSSNAAAPTGASAAALRAAEAEIAALTEEVDSLTSALKTERSVQRDAATGLLAQNAALKKEIVAAQARVSQGTAECAALASRMDALLTAAGELRLERDSLEEAAHRSSEALAALDNELQLERASKSSSIEVAEGAAAAEIRRLSEENFSLQTAAEAAARRGLEVLGAVSEMKQAFEQERGNLLETVADLRAEGVQMRVAQEESRLELENYKHALERATVQQQQQEASEAAAATQLKKEHGDARAEIARLEDQIVALQQQQQQQLATMAEEGVPPDDVKRRMRVTPPPINRPQPPPIPMTAMSGGVDAGGGGGGGDGVVEQLSALQARLSALSEECETIRHERDAAKEREQQGEVRYFDCALLD
jgi:hypothetical protein